MTAYGLHVLFSPLSSELVAAEIAYRRQALAAPVGGAPRRSAERLRVWAGMALVRAGLVLARPVWDRPSAFRDAFYTS